MSIRSTYARPRAHTRVQGDTKIRIHVMDSLHVRYELFLLSWHTLLSMNNQRALCYHVHLDQWLYNNKLLEIVLAMLGEFSVETSISINQLIKRSLTQKQSQAIRRGTGLRVQLRIVSMIG